jgi:hypothetical protein
MAVTPNFSWPTPDDGDLVSAGAQAIRVLGDAVDAAVFANQGDIGVLQSDVTDLQQGFRFVGLRTFTADGTFDLADPFDDGNPDGLLVRALRVRLVGGGGGSGGTAAVGSTESAASSGGGGGGFAEGIVLSGAITAPVSVTVGLGGAAGAAGNNQAGDGGASSFGAFVEATGGEGGRGGPAFSAIAFNTGFSTPGGSGTSGDFLADGGGGANGLVLVPGGFNGQAGGQGGGSFFAGTNVTNVRGGVGTTMGAVGNVPGGGATGAASRGSTAAATGRAGGRGVVLVEVFA